MKSEGFSAAASKNAKRPGGQPFTVRLMEAGDLPQVVRIEKQVFSDPWSEASFAGALKIEGNLYVAAEENGSVIGYCGMYTSPGEGEIVNVAVHPDHRREGAAQAMLRFLLRQGALREIRYVVLEVRQSNAGARALYEKLGFSALGIRKNFYENPREDAVIMSIDLPDGLCAAQQ